MLPDGTGLWVALTEGITERRDGKVVAYLVAEGYIERDKVDRRN